MKNAFLLIILMYGHFALAQVGGERVFSFLNIPVSARQAALGGDIYTMNEDVNQPLWNPASINRLIDNQLGVNYINYLGDLNMGSVTFAHLVNRRFGVLHGGIQYLDYGDFIGADESGLETGDFGARDIAISIGYSYQIPFSAFYLGGNLKYLNSKIENYNSSGLAADFGIYYYDDTKPYSFAAVIRNLGYQITVFDEIREELPLEIAIASSYQLQDVPLKWYLTINSLQSWYIAEPNPSNSSSNLDGETTNETINFFDQAIRHLVVGAEFFPEGAFSLRFGYNFRRAAELNLTEARTFAGFSAGFGLTTGRLTFEYAFTKYHPVTNSNTFSLLIDLNRRRF
ncbi:type IX secretion system protein PorQ [Namhaeicola litoreus]|uniref:Type IX secretion system protein PorQ n=1 Tax=Namhaeicola litoreus TaxID=1052145 RepID=A0ABW3Y7I9_9FLAO